MESNESVNPEAVGVFSVHAMFVTLKDQIQQLSDRIDRKDSVEVSHDLNLNVKEQIEECVNNIVEEQQKQLIKTKADLNHYKLRNRALTNTVDRMSIELTDLKARMDNLELNNSKRLITISGLQVAGRKANVVETIEGFLAYYLNVVTNVEDWYQIGQMEPRLLVVTLQSVKEKNKVLKAKSALKNIQNKFGKPYFINDYTPLVAIEKRKREQLVRDEVYVEGATEQPEIKHTKYGLTIDGRLYKPKVSPPTPRELIDHTPEQMAAILNLPINTSGSVEQDKSIFQGFTVAVNDFKTIRQLYIKLKLLHPTARHIVCSYWIDGEEQYHCKNYCDDDEHGAGRILLEFMLRNNLRNRVFFITRKYGGVRMGMDRFDCYVNAAKIILDKFPDNPINKQVQGVLQQPIIRKKSKTRPPLPSQGNPTLLPGSPKKTHYSISLKRGSAAIRGSYRSTQTQAHHRGASHPNGPPRSYYSNFPSRYDTYFDNQHGPKGYEGVRYGAYPDQPYRKDTTHDQQSNFDRNRYRDEVF